MIISKIFFDCTVLHLFPTQGCTSSVPVPSVSKPAEGDIAHNVDDPQDGHQEGSLLVADTYIEGIRHQIDKGQATATGKEQERHGQHHKTGHEQELVLLHGAEAATTVLLVIAASRSHRSVPCLGLHHHGPVLAPPRGGERSQQGPADAQVGDKPPSNQERPTPREVLYQELHCWGQDEGPDPTAGHGDPVCQRLPLVEIDANHSDGWRVTKGKPNTCR